MGFLAGLFARTAPELPIAEQVIEASANVEPGYLYRIEASDSDLVLSLSPHAVSFVAGMRFAVKVFEAAPTPPGGSLTILVPSGQLIEANSGELGGGIVLADQTLGLYREWLCDPSGTWLLVGGGW